MSNIKHKLLMTIYIIFVIFTLFIFWQFGCIANNESGEWRFICGLLAGLTIMYTWKK